MSGTVINDAHVEEVQRLQCIACGSQQTRSRSCSGLDLLECTKCGLQWQKSFPDAKELEEIYGEYFLDAFEAEYPEIYKAMKLKGFRLVHDSHIRPFLCVDKPSVLDVGCGGGHYLLSICDECNVFGVDRDATAAEMARQALGDSVWHSSLEELHTEQRFDLITMFDFIEHVFSPVSAIEKAAELLNANGKLFISTPNTASLSRRITGGRWLQYRREHIYYMNLQNLRTMLERCGLQIVHTASRAKYMNLYYLYMHCKAYDLPLIKPVLPALSPFAGIMKRISFSIPAGEVMVLARKTT